MQLTFLGTGDAGGVPLYGCQCLACEKARRSPDLRRGPCCALVESGDTRILIDAGLTDLTERFPPGSLSAIVLTHFHPDHVQGLLHLRWGIGAPIPVYSPPDSEGCADLYKNHGLLEFRKAAKFEPFRIGDLTLTPVPLIHSKPTFGYIFEDHQGCRLAYLTDTVGLPPRTEALLSEEKITDLAIDCTYPPSEIPRNHNDLTRALSISDCIKPERTWLTHIGHTMDAWLHGNMASLPAGMIIARDGAVYEWSTDPTLGQHGESRL